MASFKYRFEKVIKYRTSLKEQQIIVVKQAKDEVDRIQGEIDKNRSTIVSLRQSMVTAHHSLYENYDLYIKHLHEVIEKLEQDKVRAIRKWEEEKEKLAELEKTIKALEAHKEKKKEEWDKEQKKIEMKKLDEIGSQKHFAKMLVRDEEELEDLIAQEDDF